MKRGKKKKKSEKEERSQRREIFSKRIADSYIKGTIENIQYKYNTKLDLTLFWLTTGECERLYCVNRCLIMMEKKFAWRDIFMEYFLQNMIF